MPKGKGAWRGCFLRGGRWRYQRRLSPAMAEALGKQKRSANSTLPEMDKRLKEALKKSSRFADLKPDAMLQMLVAQTQITAGNATES